jgi:predicted Zn-dependent protease
MNSSLHGTWLKRLAALAVLAGMLHPRTLWSSPQQKSSAFGPLAEKAKRASEENRLDEAAALYRKALALRPRWREGWWSLGTIEYDHDHYANAAQAFERLITLDPANGTAHAMLGLCQFELTNDEAALKNLLNAERLGVIKDEQLRKVAVYHLGLLQLRTKRFSAAKETLQQLAKDGVKTRELNAALAEAALLIRPQDAPSEGTEGATVLDRAGEAEILFAQKDFDRAKQIYRSLAEEYPTYPHLHIAFGRLLLETYDIDEAVDEFQKELKTDPKNVDSLLEIAAVRYQLDSQDGLKYAESAVKLAPEQPFAHYLLGLLRLDTDDAAGAIPELEIARKAFPREARMYFSLGNAYARVGRKVEAAKARAEFARINAQMTKQPGSTVYGERPLGLSEGQLRTDGKETPRP